MEYKITKAWNLYEGDLIIKNGTTFEVRGILQDAWGNTFVYAQDSITNAKINFNSKTYRRVLKETVA